MIIKMTIFLRKKYFVISSLWLAQFFIKLPNVKDLPKLESRFPPSNLAWQGRRARENTLRHSNTGHRAKNNQETANAREIPQTAVGRHQQPRIEQISNCRYSSTVTGIIQTSATNTEGISISITTGDR